MEDDPHGLIEGILVAAFAMRVKTAYVYVRGEFRKPYDRVAAAVEEQLAVALPKTTRRRSPRAPPPAQGRDCPR